ncbi:LLM class flavin-dependent oxidoreductase [Sphingomonas rhizophila]|uniref:Luciferase-like monooxygenase n=1 Tax=Sphingomonas rhizophila TaxID=2071607 RepID=A0A7G9SEI4_9SPHN|nr:LLM class flavin-dependent oxidoreductase [Sphingomonas rhizophila]QNN66259.1 LLM class flavin-dependent oxidoreductase [Sphingomonas rhizophila]
MVALSVLDLAPVPEGSEARDALLHSLDLARHAEALGYRRFWMAEHHSMPGIASAATAVALAFVGAGTSTIRIGAGGIMLPNHSPLQVAEQFGTLESLFPGRVDLGLGRAPGTDQAAAMAMRRTLHSDPNAFPRDVVELIDYFQPAGPGQRVIAVPGAGLDVPVWILGSSTFGAELAAQLGLPYAFASHFAPQMLMPALDVYRSTFRPSRWLAEPYVMLGYNVFAADSDEEGELLATSLAQAFVALRSGQPGKLKPPVAGYLDSLPMEQRAMLQSVLGQAAIGTRDSVRAAVDAFVSRTGADELMITSQIFDREARLKSYSILAEAMA